MNRTKYDGKLTDSLIQTVIDAENRLNGLISGDRGTESTNSQESLLGQPDAAVRLMLETMTQRERVYPTPTERREAWIREHGPDESEGDE